RIGAQWTGKGRGRPGNEERRRRVARPEHLAWCNTFLDPVDDCIEVGAGLRPGPEALVVQNTEPAVTHPRGMEQTEEFLDAAEAIGRTGFRTVARPFSVTRSHDPIVV